MPDPDPIRVGPRLTWPELLFARIYGHFAHVPSGPGTLNSEAILQMPNRMVYYGIGHNSEAFGTNLITFKPQPELAGVASVAPFDTGGLAQEHLPLMADHRSEAARRSLLARYDLDGSTYHDSLARWQSSSFGDEMAYAMGTQPTALLVSEIDLDAVVDDRAWTWEGRLPAANYAPLPLVPQRIFFALEARGAYLDWVMSAGRLAPLEQKRHANWVTRFGVESDTPYDEMLAAFRKEWL